MENEIRIVVLQRGWAIVGRYSCSGHEVVISGSRVIRKWGATQGLGEIADAGPTNKTILDPAGTVQCHELGVVFTMYCNQEKWSSHVG